MKYCVLYANLKQGVRLENELPQRPPVLPRAGRKGGATGHH